MSDGKNMLLAAIRSAARKQLSIVFVEPEDGEYGGLEIKVFKPLPNKKVRCKLTRITNQVLEHANFPEDLLVSEINILVNAVELGV